MGGSVIVHAPGPTKFEIFHTGNPSREAEICMPKAKNKLFVPGRP